MSDTTPSTAGEVAEFTAKAVIAGVLLGIVFGAANAYLGLRVGLTVSASIPAAVMTVALFRLFRTRGTILEANLSQTIGSASTSLASGTIFTIPALFMWGLAPPYLQVVALSFLAPDGSDEPPWPEEARAAVTREASAATPPVEAAAGQVLHVRFRPVAPDQVVAGFRSLRELIHERPGPTGVVLHIPGAGGREQEMTLRVGVAYDAELLGEANRRIGALAELRLA